MTAPRGEQEMTPLPEIMVWLDASIAEEERYVASPLPDTRGADFEEIRSMRSMGEVDLRMLRAIRRALLQQPTPESTLPGIVAKALGWETCWSSPRTPDFWMLERPTTPGMIEYLPLEAELRRLSGPPAAGSETR